jgi:hypothetical protein
MTKDRSVLSGRDEGEDTKVRGQLGQHASYLGYGMVSPVSTLQIVYFI